MPNIWTTRTIKHLARSLVMCGYSEKSDIYSVVNFLNNEKNSLSQVKRLVVAAEIATQFGLMQKMDNIEENINKQFQYYYLKPALDKIGLIVTDDFDSVIYHFKDDEISNQPYPPSENELIYYQCLLIEKNLITESDVFVLST